MATIHHSVIQSGDWHRQDTLKDLDEDTSVQVEEGGSGSDGDQVVIICYNGVDASADVAHFDTTDGLSVEKISELLVGAGVAFPDKVLIDNIHEYTTDAGVTFNDPIFGTSTATITKTPTAVNTQTASYELVAADGNKLIVMNHASTGMTLTLPLTLDTGFTCTVMAQDAGLVTFSTTGTLVSKGAILNSTAAGALCVYIGNDTWWVCGDLV